jgi:cysteine desulfurase family protein (TIGR01976 family)
VNGVTSELIRFPKWYLLDLWADDLPEALRGRSDIDLEDPFPPPASGTTLGTCLFRSLEDLTIQPVGCPLNGSGMVVLMDTTWDTECIRSQYPALKNGTVYLDGAGGTQVPESVIEAISDAYRSGLSNVHGPFASSRRSVQLIDDARQAVADLTGGSAAGVVLGPNMTTLTYRLAGALAKTWSPGDQIVLSELDHDSNIRPWVQAAASAGVMVRWARVDPLTADLPAGQYGELVTSRTRLVAVAAASNLIGTMTDVAAISAIAHAAGALVYVDAVAAAPHFRLDMSSLGADFIAVSSYKWCGPHAGAVVASFDLLDSLHPDKLDPSSEEVPERFELGTAGLANMAGITAAVDHLAGLVAGVGDRRQRLDRSFAALRARENTTVRQVISRLEALPGVRMVGAPTLRTGTVCFTVDSVAPADVAARLGEQDICVWSGHAYAWELTRALGIRDSGGGIRVSLSPYTAESDLQRLVTAMTSIATEPAHD